MLTRFGLSLFALFCLLGLSVAQLPCPPTQPNALPLQLGQLARHRPIDDTCGCQGASKGAANSPLRQANDLQNSIKNNFRPTSTTQNLITVADMIRLQDAVDEFSQQ